MFNVNIYVFFVKEGLIIFKISKYIEYEVDMNGINFIIKDFNEIFDDEDIIKVMFIDL